MNSDSITADTLLMQNPDAVLRAEEPGGPVLFNPDNDDMRLLNHTGLMIWTLCAQPVRFGELLQKLMDEFDHPNAKELESDLSAFTTEMIRQGYLGVLC